METKPENIISRYAKIQAQFLEQERQWKEYLASSPEKKCEYWISYAVMKAYNGYRMSGSEEINIINIRRQESEIDKYLIPMIEAVSEACEISLAEALNTYFKLDDQAKQHLRNMGFI